MLRLREKLIVERDALEFRGIWLIRSVLIPLKPSTLSGGIVTPRSLLVPVRTHSDFAYSALLNLWLRRCQRPSQARQLLLQGAPM